ncbi:UDP-glucoronosyl and UDP-glucosyl transferase family protein [Stachybotrys elegans]|uniref:UDP-glucoronosyl and UDP-glucosyl transferase family protein n=1 Tax=Stachybotrys elegans TaxID=80388 RepID=A0A8K0SL05_9HYPO|nr:UDP-glucoronosyl and UDP-glucosyl transferase family protein [Stachybotrys elegans]
MAEPKRILMLTNSELGQANVFLATAYELIRLDPALKLHIASFPGLSKHVDTIRMPSSDAKDGDNVSFIALKGPSWKEALFDRPEHQFQELCDIQPTVWNVGSAAKMTRIACPWTSDEVCALVKEIEQIIQDIAPDVVVVDNLFTPAVTICYKLKPKWIVLSPNTYKEFVLALQPQQQYYWKYPPPRSTIPFPVPWYYIPVVYYMVRKMYLNHEDTWMVDHAKQMKEKIDTDYADWAYISIVPPEGLQVLLASRPEIDFPFDVVPPHITGCGPIVRPHAPLKDIDPELDDWLSLHPTVYVNTGTHATYTQEQAIELAGALKYLLQKAEKAGKKLQVLWKLNKRGDYESSLITDVLGSELKEAVRTTNWITAEPSSILGSGQIVCSVNHGGANSFFEAVSAGIPQVILPVWGDTYDFAKRVEWLGIGRFGSPRNAPKCSARELGPILESVLLGKAAVAMKQKAEDLAKVCGHTSQGRETAARKIMEML